MSVSRTVRFLLVALFAAIGYSPLALQAQEATPVADAPAPAIIASGLTNPRGFTWGADGTLFVSLAGSGGPNAATEDAPTTQAIGPFSGGPTGAIAEIGADGCPVALATGLPSTADGMGSVLGAEDVAILGDQLYASVDGGGPVHGNADAPSGVYRILADGSSELVADLSAWVRANPVAELPGDFDPDAAGYSLVADEAGGLLWVSDPNSGQVLSVTPDGTVTRVADLSAGHPVPTKMVADPAGGVYVGTLTAVPFPDGAAKVMHVAADGTVTDVWTGLTVVTDVAVGADGTLYAIEMSTGNLAEPPFLVPGSGRLVHQTGPDTLEVVADGLMMPVALEIGPDGAFYIAMPAIGANGGQGTIVRLGAGDDSATPVAAGNAFCAPIPETLASSLPAPAPVATPEASPVAEAPVAEAPVAEDQAVSIEGFAFVAPTLEITAGTTVTWTNNDTTAHTATASDGSFDTGNIDVGASASVTFDTPGTYAYVCTYHPNMTGTIVVT
jgi:plastocyanin